MSICLQIIAASTFEIQGKRTIINHLMSTRVTINIGFYFESEHYAQLQGYIPRSEAANIPELKLEQKNNQDAAELTTPKPSKAMAGGSKKESDEDNSDAQDDDNNINNQMEIENQIENEEDNLMYQQQQKQLDNALIQYQEEQPNLSEQEDNYDSDRLDDDQDEEEMDLESLSGQSMKNFNNNKTKRQKGQIKDLIQLPDKRPRKDKNLDQANEIIRREEKERKRKQYLKKQIQAQEKATLDKILNETGRKLRMREEKEIQEEMERQQKVFKTLGDVPKIITLINGVGKTIMVHNTTLFSEEMTTLRDMKMKEVCTKCGKQSKYKLKNMHQYACSLPCYKMLQV